MHLVMAADALTPIQTIINVSIYALVHPIFNLVFLESRPEAGHILLYEVVKVTNKIYCNGKRNALHHGHS